ncbi:Na /Pi symporter [Ceraceosorus bombacis]|uniref:Phosphate transporter n=1 Tax=Ceraceosorus bombacis TaxID=401625 RepID=A0A0P1BDT7_9BASI|nr:Na /Pi symporter [Ceraceosorus bombacis]
MWAEYDYLFAFAMIAAFIDAFGIGANDVANSFATSVSSRSLTFRQAMIAAAICEFLGAVLVGARVTATVRSGIINISLFQNQADTVLLAFTCVCIGSATWLTFATQHQMPVSTTHTVIGALIGVGVAAGGASDGVRWGWSGVGQIFASWGIAPAISGALAAIIFTFTKYAVLKRKNAVVIGLYLGPVYFFIVAAILTTVIIAKGAPSLNLDEMSPGATAAAILGTAAVVSLLSVIFWLPFVRGKVLKKDYTLRWYHFFYGPLLWNRPAPADASNEKLNIVDYYAGHRAEDHAHHFHDDVETPVVAGTTGIHNASPDHVAPLVNGSADSSGDRSSRDEKIALAPEDETAQQVPQSSEPPTQKHSKLALLEAKISGREAHLTTDENGIPYPPPYRTYHGSFLEPWNMYTILRYNAVPWVVYFFTAGLRTDIHKMQDNMGSAEDKKRVARMHAIATEYPNEVEHLYSFLQVLTACTASFAHGANDVANAIGPLSVVYQVWSTMEMPGRNSVVPVWILVYGGAAISIGLALWGWRLMAVLGNRLTLHSPSRGFSMEFGASITVVLASYLGIPVSTTQSITGATLGVSLCNGDWRGTNWKVFAWIFFSWVLTLPFAALISGCLYGIIANAPRGVV